MSQVFRSKQRIIIPTDLSVTQATLLNDPERIADDKIIFEEAFTGRTATYLSFKSHVRRAAVWIKRSLGLEAGDIVTIISPSSIDYVVATHAVWWLGGVVSMVNDLLSPKDLAHGLEVVKPKFLIADRTAIDKISQTLCNTSHAVSNDHIVVFDRTGSASCWSLALSQQRDSEPLLIHTDKDANISPPPLSESSSYSLRDGDNRQVLAAIVLSSGTTGRSKAVMLSHHNLIAANYQLRADNPQNWRSDMREVFFPPLSHVYATYVVITGAPWLGYYVCLMPRFDLATFCRLLSERRATMARLVPPVAKMLAESPITRRFTYPSLEYFTCSAAPLNVSAL